MAGGGMLWAESMHCWFCESVARVGPDGLYCPFAPCPACKDAAGGLPLDGPEPERWRRMREGGSLAEALVKAGFSPQKQDQDGIKSWSIFDALRAGSGPST